MNFRTYKFLAKAQTYDSKQNTAISTLKKISDKFEILTFILDSSAKDSESHFKQSL